MKFGDFDTSRRVVIVAEIGNNHEGDVSVAKELIEAATESGVDAVKFQTYIPEHLAGYNAQRLETLRQFQLTFDEFRELSDFADKKGVTFFSTPFDLVSANFLNTLQPIFKIASGDNNLFPLIDTVANFFKPTIVSTGLANIDLVDRVYKRIQSIWHANNVDPSLALMHCVSSYPVPRNEANIGAVQTLSKLYPKAIIGYSDHTLGIEVALYAVMCGARIIEKHFTLHNEYSNFRDHKISANPIDMTKLVNGVRDAELILGSGEKVIQRCEEDNITPIRRSIVAARTLKVGTVLALSDITWARPGDGLPPGEEQLLLGRRLSRAVKIGEQILVKMVD